MTHPDICAALRRERLNTLLAEAFQRFRRQDG